MRKGIFSLRRLLLKACPHWRP